MTVLTKIIIGNAVVSDCLPVLLATTAGQGSEAWHEEVESGEGHYTDRQVPQISVKLTGVAQTSRNTAHGARDKVVEVSICGCGELQRVEADVIKSLIINAVGLICVLNQLMHRQGGVVRLHCCIWHLERRITGCSGDKAG